MNNKMDPNTNTRMSSLEKGLYLLSILSRAPYKFTISQLEQISGFNRTTIYRILSTLVQSGMLNQRFTEQNLQDGTNDLSSG